MNIGENYIMQNDDTSEKQFYQIHHIHHHHHHHDEFNAASEMEHFESYSSSYYTLNSLYSKPNFLREFTDVKQTEEGLINLLNDFHQGKLHAFGENITMENMIKVREQQENLARLHFELNSQQSIKQQQTNSNGTMVQSQSINANDECNNQSLTPLISASINEGNSSAETQQINVTPSTTTSRSISHDSNDSQSEGSMMIKPFSKSNMIKLIQNLQNLCESM